MGLAEKTKTQLNRALLMAALESRANSEKESLKGSVLEAVQGLDEKVWEVKNGKIARGTRTTYDINVLAMSDLITSEKFPLDLFLKHVTAKASLRDALADYAETTLRPASNDFWQLKPTEGVKMRAAGMFEEIVE